MRLGKLVLLMTLALTFSFSNIWAEEVSIKDIDKSSNFAKEAIVVLAEKDIISGDEQGNFNPNKTISRAELVALLAKTLELDTTSMPEKATFKDVPKNHWAFKYVEAAFKAGIVTGVSANEFGINNVTNREQIAVMFIRALNLVDESTSIQLASIHALKDKGSIADWAEREVDIAMTSGLMNGVGNSSFSPKGNATKEQVAVVLNRFMQDENKIIEKINTAYGINKETEIKHPDLYKAVNNAVYEKYIGNMDMLMEMTMTDIATQDYMKTSIENKTTINSESMYTNSIVRFEMKGETPEEFETKDIVTEDKVYTLDTDNKWIEYDRAEWASIFGEDPLEGNDSRLPEGFITAYESLPIQKSGTEVVNGVTAQKYTVRVDLEDLQYFVAEEQYSQIKDLIGAVYSEGSGYEIEFYEADHQIIRQVVKFTGQISDDTTAEIIEFKMTIDINYSNIGLESEIELPKASEIKQPE